MKSFKTQSFVTLIVFLISGCSSISKISVSDSSQNEVIDDGLFVSETVDEENIEEPLAVAEENQTDLIINEGEQIPTGEDGWLSLELLHNEYAVIDDKKHIFLVAKNNTGKTLYSPNYTLEIINFDTQDNNRTIYTGFSHLFVLPDGYAISDFEVRSEIAYPWWNGSYETSDYSGLDYQIAVNDGLFSGERTIIKPLEVTDFWLEDGYRLFLNCKNINSETIVFESYSYYVAFFDRFDRLSVDHRYNTFLETKELKPGEEIVIEGRWASERNTDSLFPVYLPPDAIMNVYFSPVEVTLCNPD